MKDNLGDRIKSYENITRNYLTPNIPVFIRVDGKSFHTFTRHFEKPYDAYFINAMLVSAYKTAQEMMGFKVGFVASDEATFVLTDYDKIETQPWFGYNLSKLVSITASLMTVNFANFYPEYLPTFDARAFSVPKEDAINALLWRAKDWERNSLQMYARAHFSHKELHGKNRSDIHEMLHNIGKNWTTDIKHKYRNGTFLYKDDTGINTTSLIEPSFQELNRMFCHHFI